MATTLNIFRVFLVLKNLLLVPFRPDPFSADPFSACHFPSLAEQVIEQVF
jgi:hypothetical protein